MFLIPVMNQGREEKHPEECGQGNHQAKRLRALVIKPVFAPDHGHHKSEYDPGLHKIPPAYGVQLTGCATFRAGHNAGSLLKVD